MKRIVIMLFFLSITAGLHASIAVMPYRMELPTGDISGRDYSKLLSLTILLSKVTDVLSPEESEIGMRQMGIKPEGSITEENLYNFGIRYKLDYILIGTVTKRKGLYNFDNVYYSVKTRQIVSRNKNSASDIFKLARQEVKDTLFSLPQKESAKQQKNADIAFVIDLSYNMSDEWDTVKDAINETNTSLVGKYNVDTRIFLLPFSDRKDQELATVHNNSIKGLREQLESLWPTGSPDMNRFMSVLNHTIRNLKWRSGSVKEIVIITNSVLTGIFMSEKYASEAKKRGIKISVISCGKVTGEFGDIERLPELTGGSVYSVSYHQTVHDARGEKRELYLQRGRIFHSVSLYRQWRKGVLVSAGKNTKYVKVPDFFEEIYLTENRVTPDKMAQVYSDSKRASLLEKARLQNNMGDIMEVIQGSFTGTSISANYGKALISDGKISMWVRVTDKKIMQDFIQNEGRGFYTKLGVVVRESKTGEYGVELLPAITGVTADYIPEICRATLTGIIKKADAYSSTGAGYPPVWFIDVRIENCESYERARDIRD
jgi:hypothetical protein